MKKVRSNASWNRLTPKQRETLDRWLFEENLGYAAILPKAERELGYKGSETSLRRYYERRRQERLLTDLQEVGRDMTEVRGLDTDPDVSRKASMQMLGAYLFRMLRAAPDKVKEWAPVANLLVRNDYNEILREAKAREHQIREQAMAFAREKFELDTTERALKALPQLLELREAKKDPHTKRYEENAYWNQARHSMFGKGIDIHPENQQEEAEMVAIKREREARLAAEAQQLRDREVIINADPPPPSSPHYKEYMAAQAQWEAERRETEKVSQESQTQASAAAETEREKLLRELRKAQAEREADERERERAIREYQARAAEISDVEQAKQKKLQEQQEAERAERKKQREEREARAQARLEEMREVCGWQEVQRPPGAEEG